ncbi:hypothetical protein BKA67DRAFT_527417, partial [Truncatella angustata]
MSKQPHAKTHEDYTVAIVCAIEFEMSAVRYMLDEEHGRLPSTQGDSNDYILGQLCGHNVVLAWLPGNQGKSAAAIVATNLDRTFPFIKWRFIAGIGGGIPSARNDIRLGDVVVSMPEGQYGGVVQYDLGKDTDAGFKLKGFLSAPPSRLRAAVGRMRSDHRFSDNKQCDGAQIVGRIPREHDAPEVHYGLIASGDRVMRSAVQRGIQTQNIGDILCFEMEAAGLMTEFPYVVIRGISHYADSHENDVWQYYAAAAAAACTKELLSYLDPEMPTEDKLLASITSRNHPYGSAVHSTFTGRGVHQTGNGSDLHLNSPVPTTAGSKSTTREQLLESLQFDQIDARQLSVKKAHAKTCRWFLKTSLYQKWENKNIPAVDNQFLWIKGKPGAGKSTLMKFLLEHIRSRIRQQKNTDVIISFFFNARGNDLEKSTIGLYRSLLFQLLDGRPELQHVLDAVRPGRQWDLDLLKSLFERAIQALENASVVCLIDALDECEEAQIRDMVDVLNGLVNEENRLQICFASRHYPHITIQTGLSVILENQSEHENDIANYLSTTLRIGQGRLAEQIRTDLQKKASGVFMWVVLVVDILNKEYDEGGKHHLKERLQQLPSDLHNLFQSILLRDSKHQAGLLLCIQWVLFAKQPLTTKQLYFAILSGFESQYLADCHSEDYSEDDARKYILDKSKGLAEATKSKNPTIQFIHESVRDFLLKGDGFSKVFPQLGTNIQGQSHEALKQCCLTYMSMQSLSDLNESTCESVNAQFPFLNYANGGLLYHANQAQVYKICQQHFLTTFPHLEWVEHFNILEPHKLRRYTSKVSLLYILAEADTPALISIQAGRQSCFEVEDERYGLPILAAAAAKSHTTTLAMLELEAQRVSGFSFEKFCTQLRPIPDNLNADSRSFSFNGKQELFHQLVEHGSETVSLFFLSANPYVVDSKNKNGKTALMIAAANGHTILMEELFRRGANVSEKNRKGRTALHSASSEGVLAAATLLIDHGADVSAPAQGGGRPLHIAAHNG